MSDPKKEFTITFDDLRQDQDLWGKDDLLYSSGVLLRIIFHLNLRSAPSDLVEPLSRVHSAILDVAGGKPNKLLTPPTNPTGGAPPLGSDYAGSMAIASAAITLAPHGKKDETTKIAARKLGISYKRLKNFRHNLLKGRNGPLKSGIAHTNYYLFLHHWPKYYREETDIRIDMNSEYLIGMLKKLDKRDI
jgi:hypothetical protein